MDTLQTLFSRPSLWFILGLLLTLSEFAVPGVMICFFGVAAMLMAGLLVLFPEMSSSLLIALYIATSLALLFGLRRFMPKTFSGRTRKATSDPDDDDVAGALATTLEPIEPNRPGKVEFRGTRWTASSTETIPAGTPVVVTRRENLTLFVEKQS